MGTVALVDITDRRVLCSGTLIALRAVVTAAHCLYSGDETLRSPSQIAVTAGALVPARASDGAVYEISKATPHERYENSAEPGELGREDDIAVLTLVEEVRDQEPVPVLPPEWQADVPAPGDQMLIAGYGAREPSGFDSELSGELYVATTPFQRGNDYEYVAGGVGEPDTCPGDSGGPGYAIFEDRLYLAGVSVRAAEASTDACGQGGIFTNVPTYRAWLEDSTAGAYDADVELEAPLFPRGATQSGLVTQNEFHCSISAPINVEAPCFWPWCLALGMALAGIGRKVTRASRVPGLAGPRQREARRDASRHQ